MKHKPVALFVVIRGIEASALLGLDAKGVNLLGEVPQGLPGPGIPDVYWSDVNALLPLALACFLLAAVETAAIGRTFTANTAGASMPIRSSSLLLRQTSRQASAAAFP